jgi:hypothetical protein
MMLDMTVDRTGPDAAQCFIHLWTAVCSLLCLTSGSIHANNSFSA